MLHIKKLDGRKFIDPKGNGYFTYPNGFYGIYEDGKGFVSLDGEVVYTPKGKKLALEAIIEAGGFCGTVHYIQEMR